MHVDLQHYGRGEDPHVGPVILSNILRKGPPSRSGPRKSVTMDFSRRPGTADSAASNSSIRSVRSGVSNMSAASNMSRESFADRFGRADKKQQRLLMMQKKMELNETMQKKMQLEHRVRIKRGGGSNCAAGCAYDEWPWLSCFRPAAAVHPRGFAGAVRTCGRNDLSG